MSDEARPWDAELAALRRDIHTLDRSIVDLLARRVEIGRRIGEIKRAASLPVLDPGREAEVIRAVGEMAREAGLPSEHVREIFWRVVALSRQAQWDKEGEGGR
ncbi:MAG: chorismate mutase [Gemmatimonadaceae bacterium]